MPLPYLKKKQNKHTIMLLIVASKFKLANTFQADKNLPVLQLSVVSYLVQLSKKKKSTTCSNSYSIYTILLRYNCIVNVTHRLYLAHTNVSLLFVLLFNVLVSYTMHYTMYWWFRQVYQSINNKYKT